MCCGPASHQKNPYADERFAANVAFRHNLTPQMGKKHLTHAAAVVQTEMQTTSNEDHRDNPDGGRMETADWFVAHTRYGHERAVVHEFSERNLPHYLPMQVIQRRVKGCWAKVQAPMFPQYLFFQVPLGRVSADARYVPGVREIFSTADFRPIAVRPRGFVERLIADAGSRLSLPDIEVPPIPRGSLVRCIAGPMKGYSGISAECERGVVTVEFLVFGGRAAKVRIRAADVVVN